MNSQKMLENMLMVSSENTGSYYMCNYYEQEVYGNVNIAERFYIVDI